LARGGNILAEHLVPAVNAYRMQVAQEAWSADKPGSPAISAVSEPSSTYFPPLEDALRTHILAALKKSGGKMYGANGAASLLGIKPTTLQSKMKKLGIRSSSSFSAPPDTKP
jgi:transcriptional regulator with GAF, ATPase, and Fis domain